MTRGLKPKAELPTTAVRPAHEHVAVTLVALLGLATVWACGADDSGASGGTSGMSGTSGGGVSSSSGTSGASGSGGSAPASDAAVAEAGNAGSSIDAHAGEPDAALDVTELTDSASSKGPFTCTEIIGLGITNEWFSAGFLNDGVDKTKFELKFHHQGYVGAWADPNSPFWPNQGDPFNATAGSPIQSPCAKNSTTPDRVLFFAVDFDMVTEDEWVAALNRAIATIKMKYSQNLKWLDLSTNIRCPNDMMCNPSERYGSGANLDVSREDCYVPPYVDSAIAKVVAANSNFVGLGPEPQASMCNPTINGPHLSAASNVDVAKAIAAYYVQHP
jgi:hypothetical protein